MKTLPRQTSVITLAAVLVALTTANFASAASGDQSCCLPRSTASCEDAACADAVCTEDAYCCEVQWDACCVNLAVSHCPELDGCHIPEPPEQCHINAGPCCEPNDTPGCENVPCCAQVCFQDPFCCDVVWDGLCVSQVFDLGCGCFGSPSAPLPMPPAFSCEGNCGGAAPSGCWCDEACCAFGDCCEDKGQYCVGCLYGTGQPSYDGDWCKGPCGGMSDTGGCACDEDCPIRDDCCSGVCISCPELSFCSANPADLTGNGNVDGADLLELLGNWGPCQYDRCQVMDPCLGDFNHDGVVDGADLLFLLTHWG